MTEKREGANPIWLKLLEIQTKIMGGTPHAVEKNEIHPTDNLNKTHNNEEITLNRVTERKDSFYNN